MLGVVGLIMWAFWAEERLGDVGRGARSGSVLRQLMSRCSSTVEQLNRNRRMECSSPPAGSNT